MKPALWGPLGGLSAALLLSACGAVPPASTRCSGATCSPAPPSASTPDRSQPGVTATAHGWTTLATVSPEDIDVRVTVPGPLTVEDGCAPGLTAWLVGADGTRLEASPAAGVRCFAISLDTIPDGQTANFTTRLQPPAAGRYNVHGLLRTHLPIEAGARVSENIPVASITVP